MSGYPVTEWPWVREEIELGFFQLPGFSVLKYQDRVTL